MLQLTIVPHGDSAAVVQETQRVARMKVDYQAPQSATEAYKSLRDKQ